LSIHYDHGLILFFNSQNPDREFVLKVAALEIYNEVVKDLLTSEGAPLRLLDDKEVSRRLLNSFLMASRNT